jgi:mannose-1-phosphate guanylyltransferase / mannose-6-phosphate isomerase
MTLGNVYPVILSGGSGTRLWPLSRALYPKQFIRFFRGDSASLLGATVKRLSSFGGVRPITLMCSNDHRFLVRDELARAGVKDAVIILEPVARNTAAAIAVAALTKVEHDPDAVLAILPSDHVVKNNANFVNALGAAAQIAGLGKLVLFGITPDAPHTGYGYIRKGEQLGPSKAKAYRVAEFTEKPNRATAEDYLKSGAYSWNSGIFVIHAKTFLEELKRLQPKIFEAASEALRNAQTDMEFLRLDHTALSRSPNISVDYAVMEKTGAAVMLPVDIGWNDVGSWASLWEVAPQDTNQNHVNGDAILEDTTGSYIHSEKSLVATIGVRDLVIVDTPDALLVADKSRSQDVSKIVAMLRATNRVEHEQHLRNFRPWGFFETLAVGPRFQVKLLHVAPGRRLSMQKHQHRSEHWVVVQGTAKVTVGDQEKLLREDESIYILSTQWHRLENPGKVPLELIEVQLGSYLGEDDIIRSDDMYNRSPEETK